MLYTVQVAVSAFDQIVQTLNKFILQVFFSHNLWVYFSLIWETLHLLFVNFNSHFFSTYAQKPQVHLSSSTTSFLHGETYFYIVSEVASFTHETFI